MGKPAGFLEYERKNAKVEKPLERISHFCEFRTPLSLKEQQEQGGRCMECGVPFCQNGGIRVSASQSGTGDKRSGLQRELEAGLRAAFEDSLFSGIYFQSLPCSL